MKKKAIMVGVLIMLFLTGCGGKEIGLEAVLVMDKPYVTGGGVFKDRIY